MTMSLGYKNATGDDRRLFMRFLPTPWRDLTDEHNTHNALLGALTTLAEAEEQDLRQSKDESFLDTASGVFLNKWGNFSGVSRRQNEEDDHYRKRIKKWFVKKKGTINSLVDNILEEFEDDNLDVYIYEPWRNIFYLNNSLLNGADHLQGHYYRFAVIDIHISENVDVKRLAHIVDRYKDAGVMVYFTYENGMNLDASIYNLEMNPISIVEATADFNASNYLHDTFTLGALANPDYIDANAFYTNKSDLNGEDILAGSPYRERNYYNYAGYGPFDKTPSTEDNLSDMVLGVTEYDDFVYKFTNSLDGIGYDVDNAEKTFTKSELVRYIILTLNFYIDAEGQLQFHVDTSVLDNEDDKVNDYRYYVDIALAHMDFKFVDNEILAYVAKPITDESNQVITMVNDAINDLVFTVSDAGDIRFNGIYSANNYAMDLAKMFKFYTDGNVLSYERSDYVPRYFDDISIDFIDNNIKFSIDKNKILAYTIDDDSSVPSPVQVAINNMHLLIENGRLRADINGISDDSDISYSYELAHLFKFAVEDNNIVWNWTDYRPIKYTEDEVNEIKEKLSFQITNDHILAFLSEESDNKHITDAIKDLDFLILPDGTVTTGIINSPEILVNKEYTIKMDTLLFFNWDEYYNHRKGSFAVKSNYRYVKIQTQGSPYGYSTGAVTVRDSNNKIISDNAKWIRYGTIPSNSALDLVKMFDFSIVNNTLYYSKSDYNPIYLSSDSIKFISENIKFSLENNKILAYIVENETNAPSEVANALSNFSLYIDEGKLNANITGTPDPSIDNKEGISDPNTSTSEYVLDLGKIYKASSITLGDYFVDKVSRLVSVSEDGINFQPVANPNSRGGDTIETIDYETTADKNAWLNANVKRALLKIATKNTKDTTEIALYNFANSSWDMITIIPHGNQQVSLNVDLSTHLSKTGILVARLTAKEEKFTLDYAGFDVEWLQYNQGTSLELEPRMFSSQGG